MTDDGDNHFASDEELLSGYALGRLDDADRERMDRHAAGCTVCREALRNEMRIAAGARRLGREALKAELRKSIAGRPERSRWPLVLSAAAALMIVTGIGVYYAWFSGGGNIPAGPGAGSPLASKAEAPVQNEVNAPERGAADMLTPGKTEAPPVPFEGEPSAALKKVTPSISRSAERRRLAESAARERRLSGALSVTGNTVQEGEFWSEGVLEEISGGARPAPAAGAAPAEEGRAFVARKEVQGKDQARLSEEEIRAQGTPGRGEEGQYLVRQRPLSDLPKDRGSLGSEHNRIPTRVDQRGDTTRMTIYLDSLVDERDLKNARVDALGDDSVVVTLGGKKILYRFPSGESTRQRQK